MSGLTREQIERERKILLDLSHPISHEDINALCDLAILGLAEGKVMVPREPTFIMRMAGANAWPHKRTPKEEAVEIIYKSMLAASEARVKKEIEVREIWRKSCGDEQDRRIGVERDLDAALAALRWINLTMNDWPPETRKIIGYYSIRERCCKLAPPEGTS